MRRLRECGVISTIVMLGASVAASNSLASTQKAGQQRKASTAGPTVTVSGCLQRERDVHATGSVDPEDQELVLTKTSMGADATASRPGAGDAGADLKGAVYQLTGPMEDGLGNYIGQRVEIRGTVVPAAGNVDSRKNKDADSSGGASTPPAGGATPAPGKSSTQPSGDTPLIRLRISSVRTLGGSCSSTP